MNIDYSQLVYISSINNDLIHITACIIDICTLSCEYCYNKDLRKTQSLNLNKLRNYIEYRLNTTSNNILVSLIGGEPTLHTDLKNFCNYFRNNARICIEILSNNTLDIDKLIYLLINKQCSIVFSYHSINKLFNTIYYNNLYKLLTLYYNDIQCNITLSIMFEPYLNLIDIKQIINLVKKYDIHNKILITFKLLRLISYTPLLIKHYKLLLKLYNINNYILKFNNNSYINTSEEYLTIHNINNFYNWQCNVPKYGIYIHSNECIYNCESYFIEHQLPIGCLNAFKNIITNHIICKCNYCFYDIGVPKIKYV